MHKRRRRRRRRGQQDARLKSQIEIIDTHKPLKIRKQFAARFTCIVNLPLLACVLLFALARLSVERASCVAVHEVRFIATKSGRTDYALTNETIELSCHYLMKDDLEDVKQLVWSKDGQNVSTSRRYRQAGHVVAQYQFVSLLHGAPSSDWRAS